MHDRGARRRWGRPLTGGAANNPAPVADSSSAGTAADFGQNTLNVNGPGELIHNTGPNPVPALGDAFKVNGTVLTSLFRVEDAIFHALDAGGGGLVTYVANNVYVTRDSGSIQRGVDAVLAGGTVNVETAKVANY